MFSLEQFRTKACSPQALKVNNIFYNQIVVVVVVVVFVVVADDDASAGVVVVSHCFLH